MRLLTLYRIIAVKVAGLLRWSMGQMVWLLAFFAMLGAAEAGASLSISEIMAANTRTLADEDGEYPDWIEVHNPTPAPVSLDGWHLTDEATNLVKWRFPAVTLAAGRYLVVFASDKDRRDPAQPLHTNFKLTSLGEYLALVEPDGLTIASAFAPAFPAQLPDVSYGYIARPGGEAILVTAGTTARVLVPDGPPPPDWREPEFAPDATWLTGETGVGFEIPVGPVSARVLFVVNTNASAAGKTGDQAILERLTQMLGHQVTVVQDSAAQTVHTNGHDLVVVSSTTASGNVNTKFRDVSLPVISGEALLADDFLLAGSGVNLPGQTTLNITAAGASHPLGAGLPEGLHPIRAAAATFHLTASTALAPGAVVVAAATDGSPAVLVVDRGALLNNGSAARGTRIHVCFGDEGLNGVNAAGLALFDAAVNYALAAGVGPRNYADAIRTDLQGPMHGRNSAALVRLPFAPAELSRVETLELRVKYNDGFVAWLNGVEVARRNAPDPLDWNSTALAARSVEQSLAVETIPLTNGSALLMPGTNLLAFQLLNVSGNDADLLLLPELAGSVTLFTPQYYITPTPGAANAVGTLGLVPPVEFSPGRGFFAEPFLVTLHSPLTETEIRYTTNGSLPTATSGLVYDEPIPIVTTTVLRAAAFRPGYLTSNAVTMTYLFPGHVVRQPLNVPGWPRPTQSVGQGTAQHDYEMDPDIVNSPAYSNDVRAALTAIPTLSLAVKQSDMWDAAGSGGFYRLFDVEKPVSVELIHPGQPLMDVLAHGSVQGHSHDRIKRSLRLSFSAPYGDTKFESLLFRMAPLARGNEPMRVDNIILRGGNNRCWARSWNPDRSTYTEDEWYRATQVAMSGVGTIGHFVHLYINGLYWGLYNPVQRPDDDFASHYLGGGKDDWFSVSHSGEHGGNPARWNYLKGALAGKDMAIAANYDELREYLDVAQFIDYLLLSWYIGMTDWPQNNWWAAIRNTPTGPARFFAWDGEWSWGVGASSASARVHPDFRVGATSTTVLPTLWRAARRNPDFLMLVADRAYRHTAANGALSDASVQSRWQVLSNFLWIPIVAESARWGDTMSAIPRNRNVDWLNEVNRINGLMAGNGGRLLASLRAEGFYPSLNPPTFNQPGGNAPSGFAVELANPNGAGAVYFTLDGSDPRLPGGALNPGAIPYAAPQALTYSLAVKARVRNGATWSALNEAAFTVPGPPPLRITELMYHPALPTELEQAAGYTNENDFEFIELENIGAQSLGLEGARFIQGISFVFTNLTLAPGARALLVKNRAAFALRHGAGVALAGEFGGSLDNSGERLIMVDAFGQIVLDFFYNDDWHPLTDGAGRSLVVADAQGNLAAWGTSQGWRPSTDPGGSPGLDEPASPVQSYAAWQAVHFTAEERIDSSIAGPATDPDDDRRNNLAEYALASNPRQADAHSGPPAALAGDRLTIAFTRLNYATDLVYRLEVAPELAGPWKRGSAEIRQEVLAVDALTHTVRATVLLPASAAPQQFIRLKIEPVP